MSLERLLERLARWLPRREIHIEGALYMRRWYVLGALTPAEARNWNCGWVPRGWLRFLPAVYLHCIHRPDGDRELHNHPWWALCLILVGGYFEQRREFRVGEYRLPGSIVHLQPDTFHRIESLLGLRSWSLVIRGPHVQKWGYLTKRGFVRSDELHPDHNTDNRARQAIA